MHDIAEFLRRHPPFDTLEEKKLASVADSAEIEFAPVRTLVLESAGATSDYASGGAGLGALERAVSASRLRTTPGLRSR